MKNNTQNAKALLQKALLQTPEDFALSEVRFHIRAALSKLEHVEKKRERREVASEKREAVREQAVAPYDPIRVIEAIDMMINEEKAKIEEIQRRRNQSKEKGDDGDVFSLHD